MGSIKIIMEYVLFVQLDVKNVVILPCVLCVGLAIDWRIICVIRLVNSHVFNVPLTII